MFKPVPVGILGKRLRHKNAKHRPIQITLVSDRGERQGLPEDATCRASSPPDGFLRQEAFKMKENFSNLVAIYAEGEER